MNTPPLTDDLFKKKTNGKYGCLDPNCDYENDLLMGARLHYVRKHLKKGHNIKGEFEKNKVKRKYTFHNKVNKEPQSQLGVNFCPCCGVNILAVKMALALNK